MCLVHTQAGVHGGNKAWLLHFCPRVPTVVKVSWGGKGLCPLTCFSHSTAWSKARAGIHPRNLEAKLKQGSQEHCLLPCSSRISHCAFLQRQDRKSRSLTALPTASGALSHQSSIRKIAGAFPTGQTGGGSFSIELSFSQKALPCVKLPKIDQSNNNNKKKPRQHFRCFTSICCKNPFFKKKYYYVKILNNNGYKNERSFWIFLKNVKKDYLGGSEWHLNKIQEW